jgi:hypothetical protein
MTNPTTPFSWQMPTSTDLVTDLPADFETFGQAVATSMADLLGGTTGQVLSKASNTDMDFTWVTSDDANAIQNTIVDAKGDLISATAADTPARLAVGTNGQVLTADSTAATGLAWAAAPVTGGLNFISTNSFSAVSSYSLPNSTFTSTYENYRIVATIVASNTSVTNLTYRLRASGTDATGSNYDYGTLYITNSAGPTRAWNAAQTSGIFGYIGNASGQIIIDVTKPQLAEATMLATQGNEQSNTEFVGYSAWSRMSLATAYDAMSFIPASGTITGKVSVYGYK